MRLCSAMLYYPMLCAMPCCAMLCYAMLRYAMLMLLCHAALCYANAAMPCCAMLCYIALSLAKPRLLALGRRRPGQLVDARLPWNVWLRNKQTRARDFPWACAVSFSPVLVDSTAIELYSPLNVVGRPSS